MPLVIEDRVQENTSSSGTGAITLEGALAGFRSFSSVCQIGDTVYCCVVAVDNNGSPIGQWEVGLYTYTAANTLSRTTVLSSSAANLVVNFAPGQKRIFLDLPAYQIKQFTNSGTVNPTPTPPPSGGGTTPPPSTSTLWPYGRDANLYNNIVFQDEFNGVALDSTKWHTHIWYMRSRNDPINYDVSNSCLNIWPQIDPNQLGNGYNGFFERTFTSDSKFAHQHGYFEARIKLNRGYGLFPAWWLFNHQLTEGTLHTEIDIMEAYPGSDPTNLPGWSTGGPTWGPTDVSFTVWNNQITEEQAGQHRLYHTLGTRDLYSDFHVYACEWDRTGVTFFFDGQQVGSKIFVNQDNFNVRPMYLLLDGWYGRQSGIPNSSQTPQGKSNSMQVDYVRVWPLKNP